MRYLIPQRRQKTGECNVHHTGEIDGHRRNSMKNLYSVQITVAIISCIGIIVAAIIGLALPFVEKIANTDPIVMTVATPEPSSPVLIVVTPTSTVLPPIPIPSSTGVSTAINQACQAIIGIIPNDPEDVQAKFGIPADKDIRLFYELCQEAPNGFIIEESPLLFTMEVPSGGCIDSYSGAKFSDATVPELTGGGRRAYEGTVTTTSLTYRIAGCELKP
jgi:hypothetical protein